MVYDAADGYVLMYGGLQDVTNTEPGDTWTYKAGTWTQLSPTTSPSPRFGSGITYDSADGYVVLFGGADEHSNTYYSDTWTFKAGVWTLLSPSQSPSVRDFPSMTYDAADGYVVLFGGSAAVGIDLGDTWSFSAGQWSLVSLSGGPSSRYTAAMTFDVADNYVLLYGGLSGTKYESDTWEFVAGGWVQLNPTSNPGSLANIANMMTWDTAASTVLLVGGVTGGGSCTSSTWTYKAGAWTQQYPSPTLTARGQGALADDPADSTALEFSGWDCATPISDLTDAYTYFGGSASLTATLTATPSATDIGSSISFTGSAAGGSPPYSVAMRFGDGGAATGLSNVHTYGAVGAYTAWMWVNDSASGVATASVGATINPLPTAAIKATPDPVDVGASTTFAALVSGGTAPFHYDWRFGDGTNGSGASPAHAYSAVGTYLATAWVNDTPGHTAKAVVNVTVDPAPSATASVSPNPADAGTSVQFSASPSGGTPPFSEAWNFGDGSSGTGITTTHLYSAPGNYTARLWANDSGGGSAGQSLSVTVNKGLSVPVILPSTNPADVGLTVDFGLSYWGGTPAYAPAWRFGDGGYSFAALPAHVFTAAGTYTIRAWVNDSTGASSTSTLLLQVNPALALSSFSGVFAATAPGELDLGQALNTTVATTGGTTPLTYAYFGLPPGCTGKDTATLGCIPSTTGRYTVEVQVTDGARASVFANLTVTINPALGIQGIVPSPSELSIGSALSIAVPTTGGTAPYTYTYLALPPGCASANVAPLTCVPTLAGRFSLEVHLTDATGAGLFANGSVLVEPDPVIGVFTVNPGNSTVGQQVTFLAKVSGGAGALNFTYGGAPPGCSSLGLAGGTCSPTAAGVYHVKLTVIDAGHREANASVVLNVAPPPNPFGHFIGTYWWALVLAIAVAVGLLVYYLDRNRRRRTGLALLEDGAALDAMHEAAPSPVGHPLPDDNAVAGYPGSIDEVAPHPGPLGPASDDAAEAPPTASPPTSGTAGGPRGGSSSGGTAPSGSSPTTTSATPAAEGATNAAPVPAPSPGASPRAAASAPREAAPWDESTVPTTSQPTGGTDPSAPAEGTPTASIAGPSTPATGCSICGGPVDTEHFCRSCGVAWK